MDDVFKRISEVIGEEIDSPVCKQFVSDLKELPINARPLYFFPETGFSLVAAKRIFVRAFLNVRTPKDPGYINAFSGNLPEGVNVRDSRDDIRKKLDGKLIESTDTEDRFDFSPLTLFVEFAPDGTGVCSLSLGFSDENLPNGLTPEMVENSGGAVQNGILHRPIRRRVGPRHRPGRNH